jgi:hypothetical protein
MFPVQLQMSRLRSLCISKPERKRLADKERVLKPSSVERLGSCGLFNDELASAKTVIDLYCTYRYTK